MDGIFMEIASKVDSVLDAKLNDLHQNNKDLYLYSKIERFRADEAFRQSDNLSCEVDLLEKVIGESRAIHQRDHEHLSMKNEAIFQRFKDHIHGQQNRLELAENQLNEALENEIQLSKTIQEQKLVIENDISRKKLVFAEKENEKMVVEMQKVKMLLEDKEITRKKHYSKCSKTKENLIEKYGRLKKEYQESKERYEKLIDTLTKVCHELRHENRNHLKSLKEGKSEMKLEINSMKTKALKYKVKCKDLTGALKKKHSVAQQLAKDFDVLRTECNELKSNLEKKGASLISKTQECKQLRESKKSWKERSENYKKICKRYKDELTKCQKENEKLLLVLSKSSTLSIESSLEHNGTLSHVQNIKKENALTPGPEDQIEIDECISTKGGDEYNKSLEKQLVERGKSSSENINVARNENLHPQHFDENAVTDHRDEKVTTLPISSSNVLTSNEKDIKRQQNNHVIKADVDNVLMSNSEGIPTEHSPEIKKYADTIKGHSCDDVASDHDFFSSNNVNLLLTSHNESEETFDAEGLVDVGHPYDDFASDDFLLSNNVNFLLANPELTESETFGDSPDDDRIKIAGQPVSTEEELMLYEEELYMQDYVNKIKLVSSLAAAADRDNYTEESETSRVTESSMNTDDDLQEQISVKLNSISNHLHNHMAEKSIVTNQLKEEPLPVHQHIESSLFDQLKIIRKNPSPNASFEEDVKNHQVRNGYLATSKENENTGKTALSVRNQSTDRRQNFNGFMGQKSDQRNTPKESQQIHHSQSMEQQIIPHQDLNPRNAITEENRRHPSQPFSQRIGVHVVKQHSPSIQHQHQYHPSQHQHDPFQHQHNLSQQKMYSTPVVGRVTNEDTMELAKKIKVNKKPHFIKNFQIPTGNHFTSASGKGQSSLTGTSVISQGLLNSQDRSGYSKSSNLTSLSNAPTLSGKPLW